MSESIEIVASEGVRQVMRLRVPGGWVYTTHIVGLISGAAVAASVFVPAPVTAKTEKTRDDLGFELERRFAESHFRLRVAVLAVKESARNRSQGVAGEIAVDQTLFETMCQADTEAQAVAEEVDHLLERRE